MRVRRAGQGLAALLVAGLAFPALLRAEPLYVIEQLAVNVNLSLIHISEPTRRS